MNLLYYSLHMVSITISPNFKIIFVIFDMQKENPA